MRIRARVRDRIAKGNPSGYVKFPIYAMWPELGHVKIPFYAMWNRKDKRVDVVVRVKGKAVRAFSKILTVPRDSIEYGKKACGWIARNMPLLMAVK